MTTDLGDRLVDYLIVHCSATPGGQDFGASDIDKWHRAKGWLGNGYHVVIRIDGTIETKDRGHRCRPMSKPGAHVGNCGPGWNKRSIGICLIGGVNEDGEAENTFTQEQFDSLYYVLNDLDNGEMNIMGHRDLIEKTGASPKACPSFDVPEWLAERDHEELRFEGVTPFEDSFE